jgi:hypothetical protein
MNQSYGLPQKNDNAVLDGLWVIAMYVLLCTIMLPGGLSRQLCAEMHPLSKAAAPASVYITHCTSAAFKLHRNTRWSLHALRLA